MTNWFESEIWRSVGSARTYLMDLDACTESNKALRSILANDELVRADRFINERHRRRFIVGRAMLRAALAAEIGTAAEKIQFEYGTNGKPFLEGKPANFNLSHSDHLALLGIATDHEVGVDIERIDAKVEIEAIASRFFTMAECASILSADAALRPELFFRLWCCKEACLKATGIGLTGGLNRWSIIWTSDKEGQVADAEQRLVVGWRVHMLPAPPGFAAAICTIKPSEC